METLGARILEKLSPTARTDEEGRSGGEIVDASGRALPLCGTTVRATAGQGRARVVVEQRFVNPHDEILDVVYRMPLPPEGAVSGYGFFFADEVVRGEVRPREAAREAFERAIVEGRTAGLLDQERGNVFTQRLGNVPPRAELVAEITVDMPLVWLPEGAWELRFPTVIGPRYTSGANAEAVLAEVEVAVAKAALPHRAALEIEIRDRLDDGVRPESTTHDLAPFDPREAIVRFSDAAGERLDRDIVVRWRAVAPEIGIALATARPPARAPHGGDAYGIVTVVPPAKRAAKKHVVRDLVVLVDTSSSMGGFPLEAAKTAACLLVDSLGEADRFELVEFSTSARAYSTSPRPATKAEKAKAIDWIRALRASGSTEMLGAVKGALRRLREGSQRQVVLVTDGYIGGEQEIVRTLVEDLPASCRLHFVGAGAAVNRSLALALARAGRGTETVIGSNEDPERALARLVRGTAAPVLTDVVLEGDALLETAPEHLPDVFADAPLRIAAKLRPAGGTLVVRGTTAEGLWEKRIEVPATAPGTGDPSLVALFARECVADLETRLTYGRTRTHDDAIERLGVVFQIATRRTSWVATSRRVTVDPNGARRSEVVPQETPFGTSIASFGLRSASGDGDDDAMTLVSFAEVTGSFAMGAPIAGPSPMASLSRPSLSSPPSPRTVDAPDPIRKSVPPKWPILLGILVMIALAILGYFLLRGTR